MNRNTCYIHLKKNTRIDLQCDCKCLPQYQTLITLLTMYTLLTKIKWEWILRNAISTKTKIKNTKKNRLELCQLPPIVITPTKWFWYFFFFVLYSFMCEFFFHNFFWILQSTIFILNALHTTIVCSKMCYCCNKNDR